MKQRGILLCLVLSALLAALRTSSKFDGKPHLFSQERSNLISVLGSIRPSEGRLSGFSYNPYMVSAPPWKPTREAVDLHSSIVKKYGKSRSPQTLGNLAILRLCAGKVEDAVRLLEEAVAQEPRNPILLNDLAAAYLARSRHERSLFDLMRALSSAEGSITIQPSKEALFNRALSLDLLQLRPAAKLAWAKYLESDKEFGWFPEAQRHLALIDRPEEGELWTNARPRLDAAVLKGNQEAVYRLVRRFPQPAQVYVEDVLLPKWADAVIRNDQASAANVLQIAKSIAGALTQFTGDHLAKEMVSAVDEAVSPPLEHGRLSALARGHSAYKRGLDAHLRHDSEGARAAFHRAYLELSSGRSLAAIQAELYLKISDLGRESPVKLVESIADLQDRVDARKYPSLAGKLLWIRGMARFRNSEPAASLQDFISALGYFEKVNTWEEIGAVHCLIAENLHYLGDSDGAWQHLYKALATSTRVIHPWRSFSIFDEVADAALKEGEPRIALYFRDEVVRLAIAAGEPVGVSHSLLRRAETLLQLGRSEAARKDLEEAGSAARQVTDRSLQTYLQAGVMLAEGEGAASSQPRFALYRLEQTLAFYLEQGGHFELPRLYLAQYRAHLQLNDVSRAVETAKEGIEEYERRRRGIFIPELRMSYFDQAQKLFDRVISLEVENGNSDEAFQYAERARALELRNWRKLGSGGNGLLKPLGLMAIRERLPRGITMIEYAVLADRLVAWVVTSDGINMISERLSAEEVKHLVWAVRRNINDSSGGVLDRALVNAYESFMRPVLKNVARDSVLVISADKYLHLLPFACLRDQKSGRYLVQDHPVVFTPSATLFIENQSLEIGRHPSLAEASILAVGDPAFDRRIFSHLTVLDQAKEETIAVAAIYPNATVILREMATKLKFLDEAKSHEIIHVASHAINNQEFPLQSMIVLAPSGDGDSGILTADEIYQTSFDRARLVVLASCSAGGGTIGSAEGILNLARPFLANGVPTVMANLWQLDDHVSRELFVRFHEFVRNGENVSEALRKVQVEFIGQTDSRLRAPGSWGGLQVYSVSIHL